MAHVELGLASDRHCTDVHAAYFGRLYFVADRKLQVRSFARLKHHGSPLDDPAFFVARARESAKIGNVDLPLENLVALSVLRICTKTRHDGEVMTGSTQPRVERVAALAVAASADDKELIVPSYSAERHADRNQGVGRASRVTPGLVDIDPAVYLPLTPQERFDPASVVVRSISSRSRPIMPDSQVPYVTLHETLRNGFIEQVITPADLK